MGSKERQGKYEWIRKKVLAVSVAAMAVVIAYPEALGFRFMCDFSE